MNYSSAGQALGFDGNGSASGNYALPDLLQSRSDEIDEVERRRREAAQAAGFSAAGVAASSVLSVGKI